MPLIDLAPALQAVLGIGLVIFVHELGHYIAARMCGVRVVTFSLGFGPRLLGWRRGATTYQLALVPLGGFCRMAGEERRYDGLPPEPDELPAKSVGQRFFIYSAGVAMNLAFVLVVYPIIFFVGVPFDEPTIGQVAPGSPAWHAGVKPDSEVLTFNGKSIVDFSTIPIDVALRGDAPSELVVRDPDTNQPAAFTLQPVRNEATRLMSIGVGAALERGPGGHAVLAVDPGSPAAEAGVRDGERLVDIEGTPPGLSITAKFFDVQNTGGPARLVLEGDDGRRVVEVAPVEVPMNRTYFGIHTPYDRVLDVRDTELVRRVGLRKDDRLVHVGGRPVLRLFDARRALVAAGDLVEIGVRRREGGRWVELTLGPLALDADERLRLLEDVAIGQDVDTNTIVVQEGRAAARAGLRDGDRILSIDGSETVAWEDILTLTNAARRTGRPATFQVERPEPEGESAYPTFTVLATETSAPDYGLRFRPAKYLFRTSGVGSAIGVGLSRSWMELENLWLTLEGLVTQRVPKESMGGIVSISRVSYAVAEEGWTRLFFFLSFLSLNLAFLNILPIPVLDGGHLFFLIIEKIKGSPVSERVLGYSQMVGVVLILSLMVFVTYNDVVRWLF